jgi:4-hydroxybenzoate polyprenyltransferase
VARTTQPELAVSHSSSGRSAVRRSTAASLLISVRPGEWIKNTFVFAGLVFSRQLTDPPAVIASVTAFAIFCALAGAVYLINDVSDQERDRQHPRKRERPIASGGLSPQVALSTAALLTVAGLAGAWMLGTTFGAIATTYLALLALYSGPLKHIVIIDVLTIAIGFVLRVAAGAVAVGVPMSHWLLVCTILLAMFLGLSKRRHELTLLADGATGHRRILQEYSPYLLDQMIGVVTASTLMAYVFYATSEETAEKFGTSLLGLTIPFPLYGIFRYLYLVHQREGGGSPAELLLNDRPLLACVALWGIAVVVIIYRPFGI